MTLTQFVMCNAPANRQAALPESLPPAPRGKVKSRPERIVFDDSLIAFRCVFNFPLILLNFFIFMLLK